MTVGELIELLRSNIDNGNIDPDLKITIEDDAGEEWIHRLLLVHHVGFPTVVIASQFSTADGELLQ